MYCPQCGKENPDEAKFYLKCGKSLTSGALSTTQPETRWEYCEIVCKAAGLIGGKSYFMAQGVGSQGVYTAARSTKPFGTIPTNRGDVPETRAWGSEKKAQAALDEVLAILSLDGWEPTGKSGDWWQYKLRRRV